MHGDWLSTKVVAVWVVIFWEILMLFLFNFDPFAFFFKPMSRYRF